VPAPRRPLNHVLPDRVYSGSTPLGRMARIAGFPRYQGFWILLRAASVPATKLNVRRLERIAAAVGLPREQIFLDEQIVEREVRR
jgi:hypothetical protein